MAARTVKPIRVEKRETYLLPRSERILIVVKQQPVETVIASDQAANIACKGCYKVCLGERLSVGKRAL